MCNCICSYIYSHQKSNYIINSNSDPIIFETNAYTEATFTETTFTETTFTEATFTEATFNNLASTDIFIYILELLNNKYYIGRTTNPQFRIDQHFNSKGSAWCKINKPVKLLQLIPNCDEFDEDKYTLKYMKEKGISNVRGGSFCQIKLSNENLVTIERMINCSSDCCYICNKKGHFANECTKLNNLTKSTMKNRCFKCNKIGHYANQCYENQYKTKLIWSAKSIKSTKPNIINSYDIFESDSESDLEDLESDIYFCSYCNKEFNSIKGANLHENVYCKFKLNTVKIKLS